jgi:hypothetical protein
MLCVISVVQEYGIELVDGIVMHDVTGRYWQSVKRLM